MAYAILHHIQETVYFTKICDFFCTNRVHIVDNSINFWKMRKKRSADAAGHGCGMNDEVQRNMEIIQNSVIYEDEASGQSYRGDSFPERFVEKSTSKFLI